MHNFLPEREQLEVLASFGEARLVRTLDMKYEIRGGSAEDRYELLSWWMAFYLSMLAFPCLDADGCRNHTAMGVRETYVDTTVNVPGFKAGRRAITLGISGRVSAKRLLLA